MEERVRVGEVEAVSEASVVVAVVSSSSEDEWES